MLEAALRTLASQAQNSNLCDRPWLELLETLQSALGQPLRKAIQTNSITLPDAFRNLKILLGKWQTLQASVPLQTAQQTTPLNEVIDYSRLDQNFPQFEEWPQALDYINSIAAANTDAFTW